MGYMYGWYSEDQARLAGTFIYLDKDGNEVEVSSVSSREADCRFTDVKLVAMVPADGFLRRVRKGTMDEEALSKVIITPPPRR